MTVALVPVKSFSGAKQRLRGILSSLERYSLAFTMLEGVLLKLQQCSSLSGIVVVSLNEQVRVLVDGLGVGLRQEPQEAKGESAAVAYGAGVLAQEGVGSVVVIPGDAPLIEPQDVERLVSEGGKLGTPSLTLAPSSDGGSNGVLMQPPNVIPLHFGPDSLKLHIQEAVDRGIPYQVLQLPSLLLDMDEPSDLARLLNTNKPCPARELLLQWNVPRRLEAFGQGLQAKDR